MILVVGGAGSGKGRYLRDVLGIGPGQLARAVLDGRPCVADVHRLAAEIDRRELAAAGLSPEQAAARVAGLLEGRVVLTCDECGCSLLPLDPALAREQEVVGRLGCLLAARAETVVRLVCGLPVALKGELPVGPVDLTARGGASGPSCGGRGESRP